MTTSAPSIARNTGAPIDVSLGVSPHLNSEASFPPSVDSNLDLSSDTGPYARDTQRLDAILAQMVALGASDLHLALHAPPMVRLNGSLSPIPALAPLRAGEVDALVDSILDVDQRRRFQEKNELDLAYSLAGEGRFRVNLFRQRGAVGAVLRHIPQQVQALETLGLPPIVRSFAQLPRGLVLVTGPTGSGKSTTLASLLNVANNSRPGHILTIEDPIEYVHSHGRCIVNQREVGADTASFAEALKQGLREDPDIILVGELRDLETTAVALTAAETGHLVLATLHTQSAAQTVERIIDIFPPFQQHQVRTQLALSLRGVVCQALVPLRTGRGRAVAAEVMVVTPAIRSLIREGKTHQVASAMQTGGDVGMITFDTSLARLVNTNQITREIALELAHDVASLKHLLRGAS